MTGEKQPLMKQLSLRAMQVLGAIAVDYYCSRFRISDPAISAFTGHLWLLATTKSLPAWETAGSTLEITGLGDRLPERITNRLSQERADELSQLCDFAREISASQMWTAFKPDEARSLLTETLRISELDKKLVRLAEVFAKHEGGSNSWVDPVPQALFEEWKRAAAEVCQA